MWHNDKSKYSYETNNIIVGSAELLHICTPHDSGWVTLDGYLIKDRETALAYAQRMNEVIQKNKHRRPNMR